MTDAGTPTTVDVRRRYIRSEPGYGDDPLIPSDADYEVVGAEFDRWLTKVRCDAFDEGRAQGRSDDHNSDHWLPNPYRVSTPQYQTKES